MKKSINLFEVATRKKLRFACRKGTVSVEELWEMSMKELDEVYSELASTVEEKKSKSLMAAKDSKDEETEMKMNIVKYIFEVKNAELEERKTLADKKNQVAVIEAAIARKKQEEIDSMSLEDLEKKKREILNS